MLKKETIKKKQKKTERWEKRAFNLPLSYFIMYFILFSFYRFCMHGSHNIILPDTTAWNVSVFKIFSGPYFPTFELNTEIYPVNAGKYGPENSEYEHFFCSVRFVSCDTVSIYLFKVSNWKNLFSKYLANETKIIWVWIFVVYATIEANTFFICYLNQLNSFHNLHWYKPGA